VQVIFTVGPRSILAEFPLLNSIEPLRGLERASKPAPSNDRPLTKKAVKNQKRNKRRSDKRCAKSDVPKLAPSLALKLVKTTLRRASQQKSSIAAYPSLVMPHNLMPVPRYSPIPSGRGALRIGTSVSLAATLPRQAH